MPVEVSILTSTYVFSMLYILYLVFEFQAKAVDAGSPAENLLAEYSSGAVMGRILPGDAPAISGQAKELLLEACKVLDFPEADGPSMATTGGAMVIDAPGSGGSRSA